MTGPNILRRDVLKTFAGAAAAPLLAQTSNAGTPTKFQLACMTLPYANFPLERALEGIASAGYRYVAWGTTHQNSPGRKESVIAAALMPTASSRNQGSPGGITRFQFQVKQSHRLLPESQSPTA